MAKGLHPRSFSGFAPDRNDFADRVRGWSFEKVKEPLPGYRVFAEPDSGPRREDTLKQKDRMDSDFSEDAESRDINLGDCALRHFC
ncbi:MAG: hypothetical protein M9932_11890 [Xanthobacteraceae bacterium]|nr:hypothetical protein [Xanthobacteraceae bacterium]